MKNFLATLFLAGSFCVLTGCTSYYKINDPTTNRTYYTNDYDNETGGAVVFTDAATGAKVTVQNSEVIEINAATFKEGIAPKKTP